MLQTVESLICKTIPAAFITPLVRHLERTELNRETGMYCSAVSSKFFGTPCMTSYFGTTLYTNGGSYFDRPPSPPPAILLPLLYKRQAFGGIRDAPQDLRKLKVAKKSLVWLPLQLFNEIVLFPNNCQNVYEKHILFKCFQKPQMSRCRNKTLCDDSSIHALFRKAIYKLVGVPDVWKGQVEKWGLM